LYIIGNPNPDNTFEGRQVRFIEKQPGVLAQIRKQTRTRAAELLISPQ
jgi:hypothetical protein